jgi:hypothetical protein
VFIVQANEGRFGPLEIEQQFSVLPGGKITRERAIPKGGDAGGNIIVRGGLQHACLTFLERN